MKHIVELEPYGEILGMGGPWVGNLYIDEQLQPGQYLLDSFVWDDARDKCFLVRYDKASWRNDIRFSIVVFNTETTERFVSIISFLAICLIKVENAMIHYRNGFYSEYQSPIEILSFSKDTFTQVKTF